MLYNITDIFSTEIFRQLDGCFLRIMLIETSVFYVLPAHRKNDGLYTKMSMICPGQRN